MNVILTPDEMDRLLKAPDNGKLVVIKDTPADIHAHHIIVRFGRGIPSDSQGAVMLAMEKSLREAGIPAEVFKETMADDLRSRAKMTAEERAKL